MLRSALKVTECSLISLAYGCFDMPRMAAKGPDEIAVARLTAAICTRPAHETPPLTDCSFAPISYCQDAEMT